MKQYMLHIRWVTSCYWFFWLEFGLQAKNYSYEYREVFQSADVTSIVLRFSFYQVFASKLKYY